jgi:hypothetical protein
VPVWVAIAPINPKSKQMPMATELRKMSFLVISWLVSGNFPVKTKKFVPTKIKIYFDRERKFPKHKTYLCALSKISIFNLMP